MNKKNECCNCILKCCKKKENTNILNRKEQNRKQNWKLYQIRNKLNGWFSELLIESCYHSEQQSNRRNQQTLKICWFCEMKCCSTFWINEKNVENNLNHSNSNHLNSCCIVKIIRWRRNGKWAVAKIIWKTFRICLNCRWWNAVCDEKSFKMNCFRYKIDVCGEHSTFIECCEISWWYGDTYGDCTCKMTSDVKINGRSTWWHRSLTLTCKPDDSWQSLNRYQSDWSARRICEINLKNCGSIDWRWKKTSTCQRSCETVKTRIAWNVRLAIDDRRKIASCERTTRKYEKHDLKRIVARDSKSSGSHHTNHSKSVRLDQWTPKTCCEHYACSVSDFVIDCSDFLTCTCNSCYHNSNLSFELTDLTNHLSSCSFVNCTGEQPMMNQRQNARSCW